MGPAIYFDVLTISEFSVFHLYDIILETCLKLQYYKLC
jgi:hypothetical protein